MRPGRLGVSLTPCTARRLVPNPPEVQTPQHLTRRQRGWLEEFDAESKSHAKGSPETEGFFAKVREFFDGSRS